jgi:4-amino-4-deoxy-L-arabinose transferase-like glycosyltransferase
VGRDVAVGTAAFLLTALVLTAVGVALRVGDLRAVQQAHGELGPDAREYLIIARQMKGFYWPTYREPLHPALIRVASWLVGPTQRAARTVSLTFSSLLVLVAALAGRRLYGTWPALLAAAVVAFSPDYLMLSTEGLRPELYSVLLLTFLVFLAARPGDRGVSDRSAGGTGASPRGSFLPVIFAGVTGGLLCLTQMTAFVFVFPGLLLWALGRRGQRGRWSAALVSMVLAVLMVAPYLYVCHHYLGDSMIWVNRHASWWHQREELIKRSKDLSAAPSPSPRPSPSGRGGWGEGGSGAGKAPSPAAGSAAESAPPGGAVSVTKYLIGERPLTESLGRFARGYATIFHAYTAVFWVFIQSLGIGWLSKLAVVAGAAGFLGLVRSIWEGPRLPVAVALLSLLPVSFVVPVGGETRLFLHVLPLWVMWVAWGLGWLVKMVRTALSGRGVGSWK